MTPSIFFLLFRLGRIPPSVRREFDREGVIFAGEGLSGRLWMRDVRGPGSRFVRRYTGFVGSVVVTRKRLVASVFSRRLVNVALDDPKLSGIAVARSKPGWIAFRLEMADFQPGWSGEVEVRYRLDKAAALAETLIRAGAQDGRVQR